MKQPMPDAEAYAGAPVARPDTVMDESYLDSLTNGDEALRGKLLGTFLESASEGLEVLSESEFGSDDWRKTAHRLKGSAASLGIFGMADLAAQAEQVPEGARKEELLMALQVAFQDVRDLCGKWGL